MEVKTSMTTEEKAKDAKTKIREANYGVNAGEAKVDARNKLNHIPYNPKSDPRNQQNTLQYR